MSTKLGGAPRLCSPKKNVTLRPSDVFAVIVKLPSGMSMGSVGTSLKRAKPMLSASAAVMTGRVVMSAMENLRVGLEERQHGVLQWEGFGIREARERAAAAPRLAGQLEAIGVEAGLPVGDKVALALKPPEPAARLLAETRSWHTQCDELIDRARLALFAKPDFRKGPA